MVTHSGMRYRYMTDTGNCHGWTSTNWIAALSAAPSHIRLFSQVHLAGERVLSLWTIRGVGRG